MEAVRWRKQPRLGIMVSSVPEEQDMNDHPFLARLCQLGAASQLHVFVFSPTTVQEDSRTVKGFQYDPSSQRWLGQTFPLPHLIYDRSFFHSQEEYRKHKAAVRSMLRSRSIPFMGRSLSGKSAVQQALQHHAEFRHYLPVTLPYRGPAQLLRWLRLHGEAVLKPGAGTHGKGVLHLSRSNEGYRLQGRSQSNQILDRSFLEPQPLFHMIGRIMGGRTYLLQPYLQLSTAAGEPFDVRALVQKDGTGRWSITGLAVRKGAAGGLTSNLHGGGSALALLPFLIEQYGGEEAVRIEQELLMLSRSIPLTLESHFGRLAELGIDLGIDRFGCVWIIEVNSKPGRAAFLSGSAGSQAEQLCIRHPIAYARFLLDRLPAAATPVHTGISAFVTTPTETNTISQL